MFFQTSLGIDIREKELCLACVKASSRDIKLEAHGVYPFSAELEDSGKSQFIGETVQRFLRENRIAPAVVFMGVPRGVAILRYLEFPFAAKENLRQSLGYELEKYIPFSDEDVYFDFQIISEDKENGRLTLLLVVVKKQTLARFLEIPEVLHLGISGVEISSSALTQFFFQKREKRKSPFKGFICRQGRNFEVGFVRSGVLCYSRLFSESDDLEIRIPKALLRMQQDAGSHDDSLDVFFYGTKEDQKRLEGLQKENRIRLRAVDPADHKIPSEKLVVSYSLAVKGVRKACTHINLLPVNLRKKPSKFKIYTLFSLMLLVLIGALAWGGGAFLQHRWRIDRLDAELKGLGSQLKKIELIRAEKDKIDGRINYLNTLRQGDPSILDILKELSERIPTDAWVSRFDFSGDDVKIQGEAESASELIPILEASPMFGGVTFLSAITKARDGKERFRIGLSLK